MSASEASFRGSVIRELVGQAGCSDAMASQMSASYRSSVDHGYVSGWTAEKTARRIRDLIRTGN